MEFRVFPILHATLGFRDFDEEGTKASKWCLYSPYMSRLGLGIRV